MSNIPKKTSVGELKKGFEDISELVPKAIDAVGIPQCIKVVYEPEFHALSVDPVIIFLVLENLIETAVEAMGNTGVLGIAINADNENLVISISDSEKGIRDEDKDKIFTSFFSRKTGGLGLGLVYCKDVIQAHDGTITFESDRKGTTFQISLPKTSNYVL